MQPLQYSAGKFPFALIWLDPREICIDDQKRSMIRYIMGSDWQKLFVKFDPSDYKDIAVAWKDKFYFSNQRSTN